MKRSGPARKKRKGPPRRGPVRDPKYLEFVRTFGCIVCANGSLKPAARPSEAAHVGERGLAQKCSDFETAPMCPRHHRMDPDSHHRMGARFWSHHGIDKDAVIGQLNELYEAYAAAETLLKN